MTHTFIHVNVPETLDMNRVVLSTHEEFFTCQFSKICLKIKKNLSVTSDNCEVDMVICKSFLSTTYVLYATVR